VLRKLFGPGREELTAGWRKLHNGQRHDLCSSLDVISVMNSKKIRWVGHVAHVGEKRSVCRILVETLEA
jgi:hypothetical protein